MKNISESKLLELYENKKMSIEEIAKFFSVGQTTVLTYMKKFNIARRPAVKPIKNIPNKEVLKNMHHGNGKTLKEIAEYFGVNRNLVKKWFDEYGIICNYFTLHRKPEKDEISKLYVNQNFTVKQLCDIYGVSRKTINKWLYSYNISIRSTQRKYAHLRKIPFTRKQKEFIVGTLLGDAYLSKNNVLQIKHSEKQLEYVLWKKDIMSNYVNSVNRRESDLGVCYRWHSITHHEFSRYRDMFYNNNKKIINMDISYYLTPFALAIWVMDDGWRQKSSIKISSESFTHEEHLLLKDILKINFGLNVKVCTYNRNNKTYNYLSFNKRNSILLTSIIEPYVIDSMRYKLIPADPQRLDAKPS